LYLTQYYTTEDQVGGIKHYRHVKHLVERGHQVTVVTSYVSHVERCIPEEYRGRLIASEGDGLLTVYRTYSVPGYGNDLLSRGANYLSFMCFGFLAALAARDVDLVLTYSPPLPLGMVGWSLARLKRAKFVFEIGDVWPDALIALKVIRNRILIRLLRGLEMFLYQRADKIVLYSPLARENLEAKGIAPEKLYVSTLGTDVDVFGAEVPQTRGESEESPFIAMYVGAHGVNNALDTILEAAARLKAHEEIHFVFIGDGEERPRLIKRAKLERLTNVTFKSPVPRRELLCQLSRAGVCLLTTYPGSYFHCTLPNKIFDYLGAGRPVIVGAEGHAADLVTSAEAGMATPPGDSEELARAILWISKHRSEAREMGRRGREYVRRYYDWTTILARYTDLLEEIAERSSDEGSAARQV